MRVMITVFPARAHFLPLVPYAWALQSAGHDVCVVAPPGYPTGVADPDFHEAVTAAGLKSVTCGQPQPLAVHDRDDPGFAAMLPTALESERYVRALGISEEERPTWDVFYHFALLAIRDYHPPQPRQDVDQVIEFARVWQPDLVLWDAWFPSGAVAARVTGAAHARVLVAPDYTGWATERFAAAEPAAGVTNPLAETLRPLAERHGVEVDDETLLGQWTVNPFPAPMNPPTGLTNVPVRYVPYTGASVMPAWLYAPPSRPRVALSLGVSARAFLKGDWGRTAKLLEAVAGLDIEVIATLNDNQLAESGPLPDNVHTLDYVPLDQLLPTCSAIIHHGSTGTFAAASAAGVPQLVCDTDEPLLLFAEDTPAGIEWDFTCQKQLTATLTSRVVTEYGAGVRIDHQRQSAEQIREELRRVLAEPAFREGAERIRDDRDSAPSPVELVPLLVELTKRHRRYEEAAR
ncbi:nucleotide disphospho-sugar-binding domain-containing protein [Streptomyces sp. SM11]|uniref:nucleotide disphospho-sugar-binding domain-containing protein n=1 Tax=Streptomyces sp. SM11 TaxID=565557 RepID=UPI000CD4AB46|nr:nucleotide disphospho-sugar-binding domain-containing protein [Streptomyces sp. SM11]